MGDFVANSNNFMLVGNRLGHIDVNNPRGTVELYVRKVNTNVYSYSYRFQDPGAANFSSFGHKILFAGASKAIISNPIMPPPIMILALPLPTTQPMTPCMLGHHSIIR